MKAKQIQLTKRGVKIILLALITFIYLVPDAGAQSLNLDEVRNRLPETITQLTEEQLATAVPKSYFFRYRAEPEPGTREWKQIDKDTWHEIYPGGRISVFRVLGHTTVKGTHGTIVINVGDGKTDVFLTDTGRLRLQAFIPDKGSRKMRHLYRNTARGDTDWNDLAAMRKVR